MFLTAERNKIMSYFTTNVAENIKKIIEILREKGCVIENEHPYSYSMQWTEALVELNKLLEEYGYLGEVKSIGNAYAGIAVYGMYDPDMISYDEAMHYLNIEGKRQSEE